MKKLILAALLMSSPSMADSVYLGAWSHHFNKPDSGHVDFNERHNLTAYERNSYIFGRFKNSFSDETIFAAYNLKTDVLAFEVGVITGVMHGYKEHNSPKFNFNKFKPMLVPHAALKADFFIKPTVLILDKAVAITFRLDF